MQTLLKETIDQITDKIIIKHPEFSAEEIWDLCTEYLSKFNKKTKEETKVKSLSKFLYKEFMLDNETATKDKIEQNNTSVKLKSFSSIPKSFFQSQKDAKSDYILRISWLQKQLGQTVLFENAEIKIKTGDKIALIWKNWSWKSTLLKMIIGEEERNLWDIDLLKNTKVGFLSQDLFWESFNTIVSDEMLTALPDITQNMHRLQTIEKLLEESDENAITLVEEQAKIIERMTHCDGYQKYALQLEVLKYFWFSEEQLKFKISQLSWWEQTKTQIAKFLIQEVDLLILDEPTNHLDIEGIQFLEEFCALRNKTLICISHDKRFLNTAFNKVIEISHKKLFSYEWNYDEYLKQKKKNYALQSKNYKNQQKHFDQQEKFIERFRYKASKASQVQSRIKMLDKIEKLEMPENDTEVKKISFKIDKRLPNTIMELDHLAVWYDKNILVNLPDNIIVDKKMKIWVIGKNGIWKTTLIKTILGQLPAVFGGVTINDTIKIWSYSQVADELDFKSSVLDELLMPGRSQKELRTILWSLLINEDKIKQKIWTLSGGERAKVALTKMLLQQPHVIIMDEPTNHLDIPSKDAIKSMLKDFDGVSIIVSHDRDFLEWTSNLLWVISKGQLEVFHDLERGFEEV